MMRKEKWVTISFDIFAVSRAVGLSAAVGALALLLHTGLWLQLDRAGYFAESLAAGVFALLFMLMGSFYSRLGNCLLLRIARGAAYAVYMAALTAVSAAQYLLFHLPIVHIHWIGKTYNVLLAAAGLLLWAALLAMLFIRMPLATKSAHLALLSAMLFSVKKMVVWCGGTLTPTKPFLLMAIEFLLPVMASLAVIVFRLVSSDLIRCTNHNYDKLKK